jgi:hypothetical protein
LSAPNPYYVANTHEPEGFGGPSRRRLACELFAAGYVTATVVAILTVVIWERTYVIPNVPNMSQWTPLDDIVETVLFVPLGLLIYFLHPAGWLFWTAFGVAMLTKSRTAIPIAMAASVWFGCLWPAHFQGIMGI